MTKRPSVPTGAYRGHSKRDVPEPDPLFGRVGPGTPCGEYLRRFWQPVAMEEELGDLPLPVRILGEDLVLFRDGGGRIGLIHKHCSHRGASLEFGVIEERGISCCYHGWHYDIDGTILATPGEPAGSPLKDEIVHGAYPATTYRGLIFAYLGPAEARPPFPLLDTHELPDTDYVPFSLTTECNWLQVYENTQDPVHTVFLHTRATGTQFSDANGAMQAVDFRKTPLGMINIQTRNWNGMAWNRCTETILPNGNQTGAIWEDASTEKTFNRASISRWMVPVDDTETRTIGWRLFSDALDPKGEGDRDAVGKESIDFIGQVAGRPYEEQQRQPGDYEVQISQRPQAVHALENLGTTDQGVVMLRRLIREGIAANESGRLTSPLLEADGPVGTYCQDTVVKAPLTLGDDLTDLAPVGRAIADAVLSSADLPADDRRQKIQEALAAL